MNSRKMKKGQLGIIFLLMIFLLSACAPSQGEPAVNSNNNTGTGLKVSFDIVGEIDNVAVNDIKAAADGLIRFFKENEIEIQRDLLIVLTPDKHTFTEESVKRFKVNENEVRRAAKNVDALAGGKMIIINVAGIPSKRQRIFLVSHEMTHIYQRALSQDNMGSKWMVEGAAEAVGAKMVDKSGIYKIEQYENNWQTGLRAKGAVDIISLNSESDWYRSLTKNGTDRTYKSCALAVTRLAQEQGYKKLMEYFKSLSETKRTEASFKKVFGITTQEFGKDFMKSFESSNEGKKAA